MEKAANRNGQVNTDATIFEKEDAISIGVVIRNNVGDVIIARTKRREGRVEVSRAEMLAMLEGVKLAIHLGLHAIILKRGL